MKNSALFKDWGTFMKGMDAKSIMISFANHLEYSLSKDRYSATTRDLYDALALATRDRMIERWLRTQHLYYEHDVKRVYYLSAEYLPGRALIHNLINLGIYEETKKAMNQLNLDLTAIAEEEPDPGLGNGGLGRLAACFMDSMASHEIPAYSYGIRYEFGIFDQAIRDNAQVEQPEEWLKYGNPWELPRPERSFPVKFYGQVVQSRGPDGKLKTEWRDTNDVVGIAYDIPVNGYNNNTVNTLRLWAARASKEFDLDYFQHGDYYKALEQKNFSETISKVLYPNDEIQQGRELRLKQQYFFVSCSIQDILRRFLRKHDDFEKLPDKAAIQMNDTHPALAVVELIRILVDLYGLDWEKAWDITVNTCAYTNHTLLSEAMEKWPVSLMGKVLPRHLQIIYEINQRFLTEVSVRWLGDKEKLRRMSLIENGDQDKVRMANLAIVGSHSVNGVAELHTRLLKEREFPEFNEMYPHRFNNKTNGITPRRWLLTANPGLADLVTESIGDSWIKDLEQLRNIEPLVGDTAFREKFVAVKHENKKNLAAMVKDLTGQAIDPESVYDVQVKRIHEYKRQLMNILHVGCCWLRLKEQPEFNIHPRTFLFGGKAAPSYFMAKLIIKLICHVSEMINKDPTTAKVIKSVFLPNYRVSLAEMVIPAADVSEQISTAGFEASGTSNMKLALNGAVTIGTMDGANIEIREEVGEDNIFIFGMDAEQAASARATYNPRSCYNSNPLLKRIIDLIREGFFSPREPELFHPLMDSLLNDDRFLVLADFESYIRCQEEVNKAYQDRERWTRMAMLNTARIGKFSSDRTVLEYSRQIWKAEPLTVTKEDESAGKEA